MALMKLVDLTGQIATSVGELQAQADAAGGQLSGVHGNMHLSVTTENAVVKVVTVPLQQGPTVTDPVTGQQVYGTPTWGPCQSELRAADYHDPVVPGSTLADTDGTSYTWVQDQGYVVQTAAPAGGKTGVQAVKNAAGDSLQAAALAYARSLGLK